MGADDDDSDDDDDTPPLLMIMLRSMVVMKVMIPYGITPSHLHGSSRFAMARPNVSSGHLIQ